MSRTSANSNRRKKKVAQRLGAGLLGNVAPRARVVWGSLMASMTLVGGMLFMLDRSPAQRLEGLSVPPLIATRTPASMGSIFETRSDIKDTWGGIVIHHSGSVSGSPDSLDAEARRVGLKGLGYHFVIGNGTGMEDGELFVSRRWRDQQFGAHVVGTNADNWNKTTIGICIVGDGERRAPTEAQMARLEELVAMLCKQCGIPREKVYLARDLSKTKSPGQLFPERAFRQGIAGRR